MSYLLAFLIPPLAILFAGRPFQAVFNGLLWVCGLVLLILPFTGLPVWGAAVIWALAVVHSRRQEARDRRLVEEALRRHKN